MTDTARPTKEIANAVANRLRWYANNLHYSLTPNDLNEAADMLDALTASEVEDRSQSFGTLQRSERLSAPSFGPLVCERCKEGHAPGHCPAAASEKHPTITELNAPDYPRTIIASDPALAEALSSTLNTIEKADARGAQEIAPARAETFQQRVQQWMMACFGAEISADKMERNHRFLEEALELVQSIGCTREEAHQLVDYTFDRPAGEPKQECGGVMVTLAALCLANKLDMAECGEVELVRVWTKVEQIRAKQAAKPKHSPLPASPVPTEARLREVLAKCRALICVEVLRPGYGGGTVRWGYRCNGCKAEWGYKGRTEQHSADCPLTFFADMCRVSTGESAPNPYSAAPSLYEKPQTLDEIDLMAEALLCSLRKLRTSDPRPNGDELRDHRAERERIIEECAKIADEKARLWVNGHSVAAAKAVASAIRALSHDAVENSSGQRLALK